MDIEMQLDTPPELLRRRVTDHGLDIHPTAVTPFYLLHVVPLTLIPSATLLYAWQMYHTTVLQSLSFGQAATICFLLFLVELTAFPVMASIVLSIHHGANDNHYLKGEAFHLCAIAPAMLWLSPLFLFVPALVVWGVVLAAVGSGLLVFLGTRSVIMPQSKKRPKPAAAWSVATVAEGGWLVLSLLAVCAWGIVRT